MLMNASLSRQFLRFVLVNSFAAFVNIISRLLCSLFVPEYWAVVAGFCMGISTSYVLCRGFVFQGTGSTSLPQMARFSVISLLSLSLTWAVYALTLKSFAAAWAVPASSQLVRTSAHVVGVAAPVIFSFLAQKTFTFRQGFGSNGA
jgi:putative flippase GtrA